MIGIALGQENLFFSSQTPSKEKALEKSERNYFLPYFVLRLKVTYDLHNYSHLRCIDLKYFKQPTRCGRVDPTHNVAPSNLLLGRALSI